MTIQPSSFARNEDEFLPYGRHAIDDVDIAAVVDVLKSDWLTTGPAVSEFERAVAYYCGTDEAVAVNSGTAALHCMMYALGIQPGDEVIVPTLTFAATANCVVYQGGTPVFADVDPETLLISVNDVEAKISPRTKAILAVDYAGQPCDYDRLQRIANKHGIALLADACHSLGGSYRDRAVGSLALMTAFSFHPVKPITTGEGGMVTTDDPQLVAKMRAFRNHGISIDHHQRRKSGAWHYEICELGFNYRMSDIQSALGISQLRKLNDRVKQRQRIAGLYNRALTSMAAIQPLAVREDVSHPYHILVVRYANESQGITRDELFAKLRNAGIGVNVHYIPVHLHPYYQKNFGTQCGMCPVAESTYKEILTLPIFPAMRGEDVQRVASEIVLASRQSTQMDAA